MSHLLADRRHRDTRLDKLRGSTMAELMDGRCHPASAQYRSHATRTVV